MTFPLVRLGEVADVTVGYVGPMASEYVETGVPFLRSLNVEPYRLTTNDLKFVTPEFHRRIRKSALRPGDVVIVRTGKPGTCAVVPEWLEEANCSDLVVVRCGPAIDPRYLSYWVNSLASHHIDSNLVGAVQQHFNVGAAKEMPVRLPGRAEQERILSAIATLDEKIDLNRRMNQTLEAMAKAIFRDWFVEFGPVRRKLAGATDPAEIVGGITSDPLRAAEMARSFPDALDDDELPETWARGTLNDIVANVVERCEPGLTTEARPYVPIDTIPARSLTLHESRPGIEAQSSLVTFRRNDILFGAMRPYFHKVALAPFEGTTRTTVFVLRPKVVEDLAFALMIVNADTTIEFATSHSSGTTIPYAVWRNGMDGMPVIVPPASLRALFGVVIGPMLDRMKASASQSQLLAETRDYLLPRLMSGEVRVREVEQATASVLAEAC